MGKVGKTLGGALGGAGTGAAIGSAVPGIGTAIGAVGGGIIGGLSGIFSGDDDANNEAAMQQLQMSRDAFGNLQTPEFDQYDPEMLSYIGDYNPELAQSTEIKEDPVMRSRQESVLKELAGLADTGLSDVDDAAFDRARRLGDSTASAQLGATLQNAQARGVAGGGMEMALRQGASQAGAERSQEAALAQAAKAAEQRALYEQAYGNALSGVRGQDFQANSANANILNEFNQNNTSAKNTAQQQNLANRQQVGNANVATKNDAVKYNQSMQQQDYENRYKKAAGYSGQAGAIANQYNAQSAAGQAETNANNGLMLAGATTLANAFGKKKTATNDGSLSSEGA